MHSSIQSTLQSSTDLLLNGVTYVGLVVSKHVSHIGGIGFIAACIMLLVRHRKVLLPNVLYSHCVQWLNDTTSNTNSTEPESEQSRSNIQLNEVSDVVERNINSDTNHSSDNSSDATISNSNMNRNSNRYGNANSIGKSASTLYKRIYRQLQCFVELYHNTSNGFDTTNANANVRSVVSTNSYYMIYAGLLSVILTYIVATRYKMHFDKLGWLQKCFYKKLSSFNSVSGYHKG